MRGCVFDSEAIERAQSKHVPRCAKCLRDATMVVLSPSLLSGLVGCLECHHTSFLGKDALAKILTERGETTASEGES